MKHAVALTLLALLATVSMAVTGKDYDPLAIRARAPVSTLDLSVHDGRRDRDIPVRIYLSAAANTAPVVLFSHGLGGSREASPYLGTHWAARGYIAVFLQHPGSDISVWQDLPPAERAAALVRAANAENFLLRVADVPATLDQLVQWNRTRDHALEGRIDTSKVGMSGHSFGAVTTQAVGGQAFPFVGPRHTVDRITAAIAFSPSCPRGRDARRAFGRVRIPWMLLTGTLDKGLDSEPAGRLAVFRGLPPGGKYELVLNKAEHSAVCMRALPGDKERRNPNHHRAFMALSTAFWDAYLMNDPAAKAWLDGPGARSVLEQKDRWQRK